MFRLSVLFIAFLSVGCVSLDPHYQRPDAPVPASLPGTQGQATAVIGSWQQVVKDARLNKVVSMALNSNRDVQKAIADIDAARAQFGETRASLLPTVNAELTGSRSRTTTTGVSTTTQADGAVSSFELDLFGRNQSPHPRRAGDLACQRIHGAEHASDDDRRALHRVGDAGGR